jgi:hypothetical protein
VPVAGDHPSDDLIQEGLDSRLDTETQARLEDHLAACPDCRRGWEALRWVKQEAARVPRPTAPEALARGVGELLDSEDAHSAPAPSTARARWRVPSAVHIVAALAVVAIAAAALLLARRADLPSLIARDHAAFAAGDLQPEERTADVRAMEAYFSRAGLPFPARVLDLAMMRYRLRGGSVRVMDGRPGVLLAYQSEDGHLLLCRMYLGSLDDLPAPRERHEHDGLQFLVYERQALTLVFWPEGNVVCVLSGDGGPGVILPLAFAKAMKARLARPLPPGHPRLAGPSF